MTVSDLMKKHNMNIKQLSDRFGIPYRTVQNWTAEGKNKRECPEYIVKMMDESLKREA